MNRGGLFSGEEQRSGEDRRAVGVERLADKLKLYAVVGALISTVFAGGYNWRGVRDLEVKVGVLEANTVKKDVLAAQLETLTGAMDALRRELQLMREDRRQGERSPR